MVKNGKPKIGDNVQMIGGPCNTKKYRVVSCPERQKQTYGKRNDIWWSVAPGEGKEHAGFFDVGAEYEIISHGTQDDLMPANIDEKLKKLRDDQLRNLFT